jgi:hypothetical protein
LYVNEYRLLTPPGLRPTVRATSNAPAPVERQYFYLRTEKMDEIKAIDQKYRANMLSAKDAYDQLHAKVAVPDTPNQ